MIELSVVMPTYNEESGIVAAVEDVASKIIAVVPDSELIVIDDGSTDSTQLELAQLSKRFPWLRYIHQANSGHGPAVLAGIRNATGKWVLLLDSDMEISLSSFRQHWDRRQDSVASLGVRQNRHSPFERKIATACLRVLLWLIVGGWTEDANCPYKLIRTDIVRRGTKALPTNYGAPSAWIASWLVAQDLTVSSVPVAYSFRRTGTVSLNRVRLIHLGAKVVWQTARVRCQARRAK